MAGESCNRSPAPMTTPASLPDEVRLAIPLQHSLASETLEHPVFCFCSPETISLAVPGTQEIGARSSHCERVATGLTVDQVNYERGISLAGYLAFGFLQLLF